MEGLKLINPEIDFEFGNKTYKVRKANLEKVILFQNRMVELAEAKDTALELKSAAYALFLVLKDHEQGITEEWVMANAPGDIDIYEIVGTLGFMNRQKVEMIKALMERARNAPGVPTGSPSSTQ